MITSDMTVALQCFQVGGSVLPKLFYVPNYISLDEEQRLLSEVHASQAKWVQLSGRRLQNHGGIVLSKGLIPAPMPRWLEQFCSRLHQQLPLFGDQGPNHVLVNAYQPGCGIMPHQDGPLYHPVVCIVSLGSPAVLRFWRKQPAGGTGGLPPVASVIVMPRSLLVFQDDAYDDCLHGIEEVTEELVDSSVVNPDAGQQWFQQQQQQGADPDVAAASRAGAAMQSVSDGAASHASSNEINCVAASGSSAGQPADASAAANGDSGAASDSCCVVPRQGERISLTIRRVLKVHKALGLLKR